MHGTARRAAHLHHYDRLTCPSRGRGDYVIGDVTSLTSSQRQQHGAHDDDDDDDDAMFMLM